MKRFDRVTSLLLLLQTRSLVTARFLADYFNVSERTIYRDISSLQSAGVPIRAEAGIGYSLFQSSNLPPIRFTLDEAASLLLGEKLLVSSLDANSLQDFKHALNKIRAVIDSSDKDGLNSFAANIEVLPTGSHFPMNNKAYNEKQNVSVATKKKGYQRETITSTDRWLREIRSSLLNTEVIEINYAALSSNAQTLRCIEPIGLFYYSWHWHLIAWCRKREAYRDFRLDRILSFSPQNEYFLRHNRLTLQEYLKEQQRREELEEIEILFTHEAARFVGEQRYMFGFIEEELQKNAVKMRFLSSMPDYMARWLLQYSNEIEIILGTSLKQELKRLSLELFSHWNKK